MKAIEIEILQEHSIRCTDHISNSMNNPISHDQFD